MASDPKNENKTRQKLNKAGKYTAKGIEATKKGMEVTDDVAGGVHNFFRAVQLNDKVAQKKVGADFAKAAIPLAMSLVGASISAITSSKAGHSKQAIAKNAAKGALQIQTFSPILDPIAAIVGKVSQPAVDAAVWLTQKGNHIIAEKTGKDLVSKISNVTEKGVNITQAGRQLTDAASDMHQEAKQIVKGVKEAYTDSAPTMVKQFDQKKSKDTSKTSTNPDPNASPTPTENKPKRPGH